MTIQYKTVTVTPALAREWLGKNYEFNRLPKQSKIPGYARDYLTGRWQSNTGETIKFDVHGHLIDGANRMRALILAGETDPNIAINFDVATGCPTEAIQVIDTGASRTFADKLRVAGTPERTRASAVVRAAMNWSVGNYMGNGRYSPTDPELWEFYRQEPEIFDAATMRGTDMSQRKLGTGSAMGLAFYLFYKIEPELAHAFFDKLITGAGVEVGDPELTLRDRLARTKLERIKPREQVALSIRAWNLRRENKPAYKLIAVKGKNGERGELNNENFPQPK